MATSLRNENQKPEQGLDPFGPLSTPGQLLIERAAIQSIPELRDALRDRLLGPDRHRRLELDDLLSTGDLILGDAYEMSLYGLKPEAFVDQNLALVGRTAIECKVDAHCEPVADQLAAICRDRHFANRKITVLDPFLGSGNLLYHTACRLNAEEAIGAEKDLAVSIATAHNFTALNFDASVINGPMAETDVMDIPEEHLVVLLIDPPWGTGHSLFTEGLDLSRTEPPVKEVMASFKRWLSAENKLIFVAAAYERTKESSIDELTSTYRLVAECRSTRLSSGSNVNYLIFE
ncbi:MAG: hypothetical protein AAF633_26565 [Chloroflexota bacterium]